MSQACLAAAAATHPGCGSCGGASQEYTDRDAGVGYALVRKIPLDIDTGVHVHACAQVDAVGSISQGKPVQTLQSVASCGRLSKLRSRKRIIRRTYALPTTHRLEVGTARGVPITDREMCPT